MAAWGLALPLLVFAALAGLFWYALHGGDPSRLPSALVGKPVPRFTLPPIEGMPGPTAARALQRCRPRRGRADHRQCLGLVVRAVPDRASAAACSSPRSRACRLYGINYKDDPAAARRFLGRYGNPFARVGADRSGRTAIDFGVYGVPETYVIAGDGKIAYRHVGPLTEAAIKEKMLPLLQAASDAKPQG